MRWPCVEVSKNVDWQMLFLFVDEVCELSEESLAFVNQLVLWSVDGNDDFVVEGKGESTMLHNGVRFCRRSVNPGGDDDGDSMVEVICAMLFEDFEASVGMKDGGS